MKVLLDTCVWGGTKSVLEQAGHDVIWTGDWESDPGDESILEYAYREGRVLVTLDKDFGEWVFLHRRAHCGIVRLVGFRAKEQGEICLFVLRKYEDALCKGAIVTVERDRVRVRYAE